MCKDNESFNPNPFPKFEQRYESASKKEVDQAYDTAHKGFFGLDRGFEVYPGGLLGSPLTLDKIQKAADAAKLRGMKEPTASSAELQKEIAELKEQILVRRLTAERNELRVQLGLLRLETPARFPDTHSIKPSQNKG